MLREFTTAQEMLEFYRELRNRKASSWIVPRRLPAPLPESAATTSETAVKDTKC